VCTLHHAHVKQLWSRPSSSWVLASVAEQCPVPPPTIPTHIQAGSSNYGGGNGIGSNSSSSGVPAGYPPYVPRADPVTPYRCSYTSWGPSWCTPCFCAIRFDEETHLQGFSEPCSADMVSHLWQLAWVSAHVSVHHTASVALTVAGKILQPLC
jgi:hypothetical protein